MTKWNLENIFGILIVIFMSESTSELTGYVRAVFKCLCVRSEISLLFFCGGAGSRGHEPDFSDFFLACEWGIF